MRWVARCLALAVVLTACTPPSSSPPSDVFGGEDTQDETAEDADPRSATVQIRDFQLEFRLQGTIDDGSALSLDPPPGLVLELTTPPGTRVDAGTPVGEVRLDPETLAALEDEGTPLARNRLSDLERRLQPMVAPIAGTIEVAGSQTMISVAGTDAVVQATPIQWLRLRYEQLEGDATLETSLGTRTVRCDALWFEVTDADDPEDGAVALRCRLPRTVESVAGMRAHLVVRSEVIPDATLVPNSAIGLAADAYTVTIEKDGTETVVEVDVGPSDGAMRVVRTELPEGARLVAPSDNDR
jgi:hypothetical protein